MLTCSRGRLDMKKFLLLICTGGILASLSALQPAEAFSLFHKKNQPNHVEQDYGSVELDLNDDDKHKIEKNEPVQKIESMDLSEDEKAKTLIKQEPYWGLFTGAILIKKEVFDSVGYFSEATQTGEIIEWQSKMDSNNFKVKKIDFVSTLRRIHSTNFGKTNQKTEFKNYATILRAKLKNRNAS